MLWLTLRRLGSQDADIRKEAARKLAGVTEDRAIQALVGAMNDEKMSVVQEISAALIQTGCAAIPHLAKALSPDQPVVTRREAARALIAINDAACIDALTTGLSDPDSDVRRIAVAGMKSFDWRKSLEVVLRLVESDPVNSVRQEALQLIAKELEDPRVVSTVIMAAQDPEKSVSYTAVRLMKENPRAQWLSTLLKLVDREEWDIREKAAEVLGLLKDEKATPALVNLLKDPNSNVRAVAVWSIAEIGGPIAADQIAACVGDPESWVRSAAIRALKKLGTGGAMKSIAVVLNDPDQSLRMDAASALRELRWIPSTDEEQAAFAIAAGNYQHVASFGVKGFDALLKAMQQESLFDKRIECAIALSAYPAPPSVDALFMVLEQLLDEKHREKKCWSDLTLKEWQQKIEEAFGAIGEAAVEPLRRRLRMVRSREKDARTQHEEKTILDALRKAARCPICNRGLNFERKISGVFFGEDLMQVTLGTAYKCRRCSRLICVGCAETQRCSNCQNNVFDVAVE